MKPLGKFRFAVGATTLLLAVASSMIGLTVRDANAFTAVILFGGPWLVRLVLIVIATLSLRPLGWSGRILACMVAGHSLLDGWHSFHWHDELPPVPGGFDVTLWNCNHGLAAMPHQWPALAGPQTRLVVLIESGQFKDGSWEKFTAAHPDFAWQQLDGGIVVGVRGLLLKSDQLAGLDRQRCHRIAAVIDGRPYTILANDIPSQPWLLRKPYLDRIRESAPASHCLILGDFNTPPASIGYDAWRTNYTLANEALAHGFQETWLYGAPVLTLDQLWLSRDLQASQVTQHPSPHSDHVRMTFHVGNSR